MRWLWCFTLSILFFKSQKLSYVFIICCWLLFVFTYITFFRSLKLSQILIIYYLLILINHFFFGLLFIFFQLFYILIHIFLFRSLSITYGWLAYCNLERFPFNHLSLPTNISYEVVFWIFLQFDKLLGI